VAVVNMARRNDASYPFKTTGTAEGPFITGQYGASYYLSAVEKGGEPAGTRRFRFEWPYRPASMRRVIAGFPGKAIAQYSSRRAQITKTTPALADQHEKDRGHVLGQRVLASIGRFANAMTRRAKGPGALDFTAPLCGWERASRAAELRRRATSREPSGTQHHAQALSQGRVVAQTQNSYGRLGGSRPAGNSRIRRNVCVWPPGAPVWRGRKSRVSRGLARILFTALASTCPTTSAAGTRSTPGSSSKNTPHGRSYTRARLEARWAIRLGRWPRRRQLTMWCRCLVHSRR
jgi:hypothetical protein